MLTSTSWFSLYDKARKLNFDVDQLKKRRNEIAEQIKRLASSAKAPTPGEREQHSTDADSTKQTLIAEGRKLKESCYRRLKRSWNTCRSIWSARP